MIFLEIISILLLAISLIMILVGTIGILGYRFLIELNTRKNALVLFSLGFMLLYLSGIINSSVKPNEQNFNLALSREETTTTLQSNISSPNTTKLPSSTVSVLKINMELKEIALEHLQTLILNDNFTQIPEYDRDFYFGSWTDEDNDCQNTRAEVLINESFSSISFRDNNNCVVQSGEWYDPYTDLTFNYASDLDIDHFVPLYNAWYSGAYLWEEYKRVEFANYLEFEDHLIAVESSTNREKGKSAPHEWMPPNINYHCDYVVVWIEIKYLWELTLTTSEYNFLFDLLSEC